MPTDRELAFPQLSARHIAELKPRGTVRAVAAGDVLFSEGERDTRTFLFIGAVPHTGWLETSLPGVFAAAAARSSSIKRVALAVGEGSIAICFVHTHLGVSA